MKLFFLFMLITGLSVRSQAQFTGASLQASGLTCSMCSKAVKNALEKVSFVERVGVDLESQQYHLEFKKGAPVEFDVLNKAVEDAGFSVANLKVTASVSDLQVAKDSHVKIGNQYFHFLNAKGQQLNGPVTFSIVDKGFVSAKAFKKYASASKMECVQTGKAAKCCSAENIAADARVYHVII